MQTVRHTRWVLGSQVRVYLTQISKNSTATASVKHGDKVRPYSEVPGPKPIPILGNAWRFIPVIGTFQTTDFMELSFNLHHQYGDTVKISNIPGKNDMLMIFNPEAIEQVYRHEGPWPTRLTLGSVEYFRTKVRGDFFEGHQGLVNENGKNWQTARSVVNQPMMQPKVAKQYAARIDQVAQDFVKRIPDLRDENSEMPENFNNELNKWALESIALVALDTRLGCLEPSINHDSDPQKMIVGVDKMFDLSFDLDMKIPIWKLFTTPKLAEFCKHSEIFLNIANKYVELARAKFDENTPEEEQSVLQKILKRDPSTKRAVIMAMDMMFAGIDTTSHSVATVLYYLARNPESQERLFSELCQYIPAGPSTPLTAEQLDSMKYLKACIKEAIRISPVATGNMRILDKEIVLNNYLIPPKVDIMMFNSTLCNMDEHYPEAKRYIPERWLRGTDNKCPFSQKSAHPYVYMPFGHGARQCVGMRFANIEMETLVARIIRNYKLEWHYGDMKFISKMLQMPNSPLKFKMTDRLN